MGRLSVIVGWRGLSVAEADAVAAILYRGNFSSAAVCPIVGAPYFAPMVLWAWPVV
jgi:hypothetical protein